jgi:hypothetical protein
MARWGSSDSSQWPCRGTMKRDMHGRCPRTSHAASQSHCPDGRQSPLSEQSRPETHPFAADDAVQLCTTINNTSTHRQILIAAIHWRPGTIQLALGDLPLRTRSWSKKAVDRPAHAHLSHLVLTVCVSRRTACKGRNKPPRLHLKDPTPGQPMCFLSPDARNEKRRVAGSRPGR